jgi:hypothetical protein
MSAKKTPLAIAENASDLLLSEEFDQLMTLIEQTYQTQQRLLQRAMRATPPKNRAIGRRRFLAAGMPLGGAAWQAEIERTLAACRPRPPKPTKSRPSRRKDEHR